MFEKLPKELQKRVENNFFVRWKTNSFIHNEFEDDDDDVSVNPNQGYFASEFIDQFQPSERVLYEIISLKDIHELEEFVIQCNHLYTKHASERIWIKLLEQNGKLFVYGRKKSEILKNPSQKILVAAIKSIWSKNDKKTSSIASWMPYIINSLPPEKEWSGELDKILKKAVDKINKKELDVEHLLKEKSKNDSKDKS